MQPCHIVASRPLFGYRFTTETLAELIAQATAEPEPGEGVRLVVTANLDHIVQLRSNAHLRLAYQHAWRRTIDGAPVFLYARMRGLGVPARITGADLVPELLQHLQPGIHRPFFVVASEPIAIALRQWASARGFAADACGIDVPPFGFESDLGYGAALAERIRGNRTTQLLFGVGCPKSETWIVEHESRLGDLYAFAVGAALAFFVGIEHRAPRLVRRAGFEWLWRVYQEPKRLARRYFIHSWGFAAALMDDIRGSGGADT